MNTCYFLGGLVGWLASAGGPPNGREVVPYCGFDLHFPDDGRRWAFFIRSLAVCASSSENCLRKSLARF